MVRQITYFVFRPHRWTESIDAGYSYRCYAQRGCLSVCRSPAIVSCAKTAEPIDLPFGMGIQGDQRAIVLDDGPDRPNIRNTCPQRVRGSPDLEFFTVVRLMPRSG